MYKSLEETGNITFVSDKKGMSFILTEENNVKKAYITNIGVNTIAKRMI